MLGASFTFASPWLLLALVCLPVIWWLLRLAPPLPQKEVFPPTRILLRLLKQEETPAQSPWWLTLLRLVMAAFVILAMADPILDPTEPELAGEGPILIVMDDGWSSAKDWKIRKLTALAIAREAKTTGRPVALLSATARTSWTGLPVSADEAIGLLNAANVQPLIPEHDLVSAEIQKLRGVAGYREVLWLSDGLHHSQTEQLIETLEAIDVRTILVVPDTMDLPVIAGIANNPARLVGTVVRPDAGLPAQYEIIARSKDGLAIARTVLEFSKETNRARFTFEQPVELRNQIDRIEIKNAQNAGAIKLLDENNRRRLVGLVSGESYDQSQPLLSPLYYIAKALKPFADIRRSNDANADAAIADLINQGVSVIVLADVGTLTQSATERLKEWMNSGGMLVRFAGPRLAAAPQGELLPVDIRPGDRNLGGALSWDTPKPIAVFPRSSPFFGMETTNDVLIAKQLLAIQETGLEEKTWATLNDGTPIVTAEKRGAGYLVLYHVGSDTQWSNLPLYGTFVEMLRRTVNLSVSTIRPSSKGVNVLPPFRLLDGKGNFTPVTGDAQPLTISNGVMPKVSIRNPPGFYGSEEGTRALNLFDERLELTMLDAGAIADDFERRFYEAKTEFPLRTWLLFFAALLLIADCFVVLWMSGALRGLGGKLFGGVALHVLTIAVVSIVAALIFSSQSRAQARDTDTAILDYSASLQTRLAYVITGIDRVDRISAAGLRGLTHFLATRTALEPGEPVGLDISTAELSFYSLIYWPVDPASELPDVATMARIDAFMKQGGSILFDTRDEISGVVGGTSASPSALALQQILTSLDIPPLEPVPENHVLKRSFYLLDNFPGRYATGDMWVEAGRYEDNSVDRPARAGDGVSSILITSNDFAGAWAIDDAMRPIFPTIPADPMQRVFSYRVGVNLVMYALTGNYKSDQVHLPALLERLGQ